MIVLPNSQAIDLESIAEYFGIKWSVVAEDYSVETDNFTYVSYLEKGFRVFKSAIPDPEGRSLDEDLDLASVDGFYFFCFTFFVKQFHNWFWKNANKTQKSEKSRFSTQNARKILRFSQCREFEPLN